MRLVDDKPHSDDEPVVEPRWPAKVLRQLFWTAWGLMIYAFSIETYVTGSKSLWRTLGLVGITVFILAFAVVPLIRVLRAWRRAEGRTTWPKD